jgi:hypothetical protein
MRHWRLALRAAEDQSMDKIRKPDVWADFANAVGLLSAAKCPNLAILADRDPNGHGCFWCSQRQRLL